MDSTNQAIIKTFYYICKQTRTGYVRISQERILEILKTYYQTDICRRTLNYHLRRLEDNSFIRRVRRHRRGDHNQVLFHTSLNILQKKALSYLAKIAHWLQMVGWKFRCAPVQNIIFSREQFQKEMIQNYRLQFNSS